MKASASCNSNGEISKDLVSQAIVYVDKNGDTWNEVQRNIYPRRLNRKKNQRSPIRSNQSKSQTRYRKSKSPTRGNNGKSKSPKMNNTECKSKSPIKQNNTNRNSKLKSPTRKKKR